MVKAPMPPPPPPPAARGAGRGAASEKSPMPPAPGRYLPALLLLFAGSGCAALIYEIVWFQLLQMVIGSSAVSLGVLLGTFMGGMCLGSIALARFIPARLHPLRVYALLEAGLGVLGLMVLLAMPLAARLYVPIAGPGLPGILLRGAMAAVCLLPPTLLMGATLPAIARWVERTPKGISWLGFFYGGNIGGAVVGCLVAGFYLLRVHDMATATFVAAALNGVVALLGFALAARAPYFPRPLEASSRPPRGSNGNSWPILIAIALSGACALGAEVIWTRLLSLMLGPTIYTFSIILAVFLIGLGIGSSAGSLAARWISRPRLALAGCQMLLAVAIAWTAWIIARSLPYWPVNPSLSTSPWFTFQLDFVRCVWAILPATCLWGASFPLALAAVAASGTPDTGRLVGRVYAANTVGGIIGAASCSLWLIAWAGTAQSQRLLIGVSILAAVVVIGAAVFARNSSPREEKAAGTADPIAREGGYIPRPSLVLSLAALAGLLVLGAVLAWSVPEIPWGLIAHGRYLATKTEIGKKLFTGEGMNASVAVTELDTGVRNFHVSGKVEASSDATDMRLQRMLGHIPALLHPKPRSVLVVGCGAGVTAGSFVTHPEVDRIVICEIEPLIPKVVSRYFSTENHNVVNDPRTQVVDDDARHYILTTREKFDIVTSDPIHPWVKGVAALYTREYYQLVKEHLKPGGLVAQWVPLYESSPAAVKSEIATFFEVFPHGTIWSNDQDGEGYDLVLLGQADGLKIDVEKLEERLQTDARTASSLKEVGFRTVVSLLSTYAGRAEDLKPWLKEAEINRDRNLRLQYLAGLGLNLNRAGSIFDEMLRHRTFPEDLFVASEVHERMLRLVIEPSKTSGGSSRP